MSSAVKFVDSRRETRKDLSHYLQNDGYALADCIGRAISEPDYRYDGCGILIKDVRPKSWRNLWGVIKPLQKFLGVIWTNNPKRNATPRKWVFEFYGEENVILASELSEELSAHFDVDGISLQFISSDTLYELDERFLRLASLFRRKPNE